MFPLMRRFLFINTNFSGSGSILVFVWVKCKFRAVRVDIDSLLSEPESNTNASDLLISPIVRIDSEVIISQLNSRRTRTDDLSPGLHVYLLDDYVTYHFDNVSIMIFVFSFFVFFVWSCVAIDNQERSPGQQ